MRTIPRPERLFVRAWPLLLSVAVLVITPLLVSLNREMRVAVKASIYLPEMMVPLPVRPIELISDAPHRERITIEYESRNGPRTIEADLYIPRGAENAPGVVFSMGAPPLDLDDPNLTRIADVISRAGVVLLLPFSERLEEERIETEEIDALVEQFRYVQSLPQVDPDRVGYFGASVGGSLALVAAADERIADEVDYVVSFGGFFDALETFGAVATHHISYGDVDEEWIPRRHAEDVVAQQLINRLDEPRDRDLLYRVFLERESVPDDQLASLSPPARSVEALLANDDPTAVARLFDDLPDDVVADLEQLSPKNSIHRVEAELFIIHDRADEYIPYTELRRFRDALPERDRIHLDETRIFEHVQPRLGQQPDVLVLDTSRLLYRMYQLLLRWE